jgi:hypothetical protein
VKLKELLLSLPTLSESVEYVKFSYKGHSKDTPSSKRPRVKVLDYNYPGIPGQKTYGKRKDLLGWNVNYYSNKRYARKAIDEIDSFAKLLGAENKEKYSRIKYFFPEQSKLLRRYMRRKITNLRRKSTIGLWKKTDYTDLIQRHKERF